MSEPQIVELGSFRVIGMRYAGMNENNEIPALWGSGFPPRMAEVKTPPGGQLCFGLCRCLTGATDGSFEYIAAIAATPDAPIPDGMVEANIGAGTYAAFTVKSLNELKQAFGEAYAWIKTHSEWENLCDYLHTGKCECTTYPWFELYTDEYPKTGKLYIYAPIKPA